MVGGKRPLLPAILFQIGPVVEKSAIANRYTLVGLCGRTT